MVNCVIPVLADNPLAYNLVLVFIFSTEEDLRGNTAKLVDREVRLTYLAQTRSTHCSERERPGDGAWEAVI